jgi:hypothetical protein
MVLVVTIPTHSQSSSKGVGRPSCNFTLEEEATRSQLDCFPSLSSPPPNMVQPQSSTDIMYTPVTLKQIDLVSLIHIVIKKHYAALHFAGQDGTAISDFTLRFLFLLVYTLGKQACNSVTAQNL